MGESFGEAQMIPRELFIKDGEIELNKGRKGVTLSVANSGDRPRSSSARTIFFLKPIRR